ERKAWEGTLPDTKIDVHIEAAGYRGRPVLFDIVGPWTPASREPSSTGGGSTNAVFIYILVAAAAVAAHGNVPRGRADQRGAFRLATFTFFLMFAIWLVAPHVGDTFQEQQRFFDRLGIGLFLGGVLYLFYLGLEPFVRRAWPTMLVGWSRLLAGRMRDPLIGPGVVVGLAGGGALARLHRAAAIVPPMFGLPEPPPHTTESGALMGIRPFMLTFLGSVNNGLQNALIMLFQFSVLRVIFEVAIVRLQAFAATRWNRAARFRMSEKTSQRLFIALSVAALTLIQLSGYSVQRF